MDGQNATTAPQSATEATSDEAASNVAQVEDVLVEEVSIDGMCGVY